MRRPPPTGLGTLPRVDMVLDPGVDYTPKSTPTDDYRCLIVDPGLTQDRDVIGYDIVPGVRSQVHHVILYVATKASAQAKDSGEAGPGWTCFGGPGTSSPRMLGGWVPGSGATLFPAGTGIRLKAGEVLVMQNPLQHAVNRLPTGGPHGDEAAVLPHSRCRIVATFVSLAQDAFSIPPRSTGYSARAPLVSPANAKVHGVLPHMHPARQEHPRGRSTSRRASATSRFRAGTSTGSSSTSSRSRSR